MTSVVVRKQGVIIECNQPMSNEEKKRMVADILHGFHEDGVVILPPGFTAKTVDMDSAIVDEGYDGGAG